MNVCPSCGTSNPESAKFCLECGTRLTPPPSNEPSPPPADQGELENAGQTTAPPEAAPKPKKDVSGAPPPWMPAPVTLSSIPSAPPPTSAPPPVTTTTTTTTTPVPDTAAEPATEETAYPPVSKDVSGLPPSWMPAPVDLGAPRPFSDGKSGSDPDWKMSDPGPLPDRKDRRLWLWIPVGLITAVLICCIVFFIWATTIGKDTVDGWATNAAVNQSEESQKSGD